MAIKINVALTTKSGLAIPSGSVATFTAKFPDRQKKAVLPLVIWKDEASVGVTEPLTDEVAEFDQQVVLEYDKATFVALTFAQIQNDLEAHLEGILGANTCEQVDLIPA